VAHDSSPRWRAALRGNVLAVGIVSFFTDFSSEMIYPLLPAFLTGLAPLGSAAVYVGLMEGIAETTASLLKLVSGRVSDTLGRRKALVVLGYGLSTICRPLMAAAGAAWHVVGLRFADRVGKGIRTSPRDAIVGDSVDPDHRGLAFSFHRAMDHAGAVFGPVVAAAILWRLLGRGVWGTGASVTPGEVHALRLLFAVALLPGLCAMAALFLGVREVAPDRGDLPPLAAMRSGLPARFYGFVGVTTLFALGNSSDLFLLLYGQTRFGLGMGAALGLWVALHLSKIAFSFPGGILSDRFGRRRVIVTGWVVYALVYLGMARVTTAGQYCALFVAYGLYYGMTEGAEKAMVADFVPSGRRGTAYGLYHGAIGLAALPASVLFGWIWKSAGAEAAFSFAAALAGLAAVLLPFVPRGER
jgi:MFS family permease